MEIRYASNPVDFATFTNERVRQEFLVQKLFTPGKLPLVYSHYDRIITGGACPDGPMELPVGKELGTDYFLERREMGIVNVGPKGVVTVDGDTHELAKMDALYIGRGAKKVVFESEDNADPARFYINSAIAHSSHPTTLCTREQAKKIELGSQAESNARTINQYIHPDVMESCNLLMGITQLKEGSVWNTMPCHTHERRMEVYFYFNLSDDAVAMHFMGEPSATRNLVVRNEEAVISPPWSIHSACGTEAYTFIWGMVGDNQTFTDMDHVNMSDLG
jgi:4-deoxy-L-threo-5-hexosulose-uronate ketol-isomerase